jgi:predicted butyrate kinase (DUF1464 family)
MTRAVGIDPGTVSIDVCGLQDGQLYLDDCWPTEQALGDPDRFVRQLTDHGVPDLVAGPSGYGLPLVRAELLSDADLRLAFLAAPDEPGGIGGLRRLARLLAESGLPVVFTPGVIHLPTVPEHRKLNRVDLGTADKLAAAALGIQQESQRGECFPEDVSFILVELGGAFTAAVAVERGQVVDGIGGTAGPIGWQAAGALDGEVAFLSGHISKAALFQGGVTTLVARDPGRAAVASEAYAEGAIKAVRQLRHSAPSAQVVLLSGRHSAQPELVERLKRDLNDFTSVRQLVGFARAAKQGAQGAAVMADGLLGGRHAGLVDRLALRDARGTVLDHLIFLSSETARERLGLVSRG